MKYMNRKSNLTFVAVLLSVLFFRGPALGLMFPVPFEQLVASSNHIIRAAVLGKASYWNESHNYIFTRVTLNLLETYKGSQTIQLPTSIPIRIDGGTVNDTMLWVEDMPHFDLGEEVVVFLQQKDSLYEITAFEQGKFTVANGEVQVKGNKLPLSAFVDSIQKAMKK